MHVVGGVLYGFVLATVAQIAVRVQVLNVLWPQANEHRFVFAGKVAVAQLLVVLGHARARASGDRRVRAVFQVIVGCLEVLLPDEQREHDQNEEQRGTENADGDAVDQTERFAGRRDRIAATVLVQKHLPTLAKVAQVGNVLDDAFGFRPNLHLVKSELGEILNGVLVNDVVVHDVDAVVFVVVQHDLMKLVFVLLLVEDVEQIDALVVAARLLPLNEEIGTVAGQVHDVRCGRCVDVGLYVNHLTVVAGVLHVERFDPNAVGRIRFQIIDLKVNRRTGLDRLTGFGSIIILVVQVNVVATNDSVRILRTKPLDF